MAEMNVLYLAALQSHTKHTFCIEPLHTTHTPLHKSVIDTREFIKVSHLV